MRALLSRVAVETHRNGVENANADLALNAFLRYHATEGREYAVDVVTEAVSRALNEMNQPMAPVDKRFIAGRVVDRLFGEGSDAR